MFRLAVCLMAVAGLTWTVATATAAASPEKLYTGLLTMAYPNSQLPSGFFSAKVGLIQPSKTGRHYHEVGSVTVTVDGPDPDDGSGFNVFPNHKDALGDLNHPNMSSSHGKIHIVPGGVPGVGNLPSHMWAGHITGKNAFGKTVTDGVTLVAVVTKNVIVQAYTDSADNTNSGNIPGAIALLKSGLRHLQVVEKKLAPKH